jgi:hypothetical protein
MPANQACPRSGRTGKSEFCSDKALLRLIGDMRGDVGKIATNRQYDYCDENEKSAHSCSLTSLSDKRCVLTIFHFPAPSNRNVKKDRRRSHHLGRQSDRKPEPSVVQINAGRPVDGN